MLLDIGNTFSLLISFLLGLGAGLAFFSLVYLVVVLSSMRDKKYIIKTKVKDVTDEEIKSLILETQEMFKDKKLRGDQNMFAYCGKLTYSLIEEIATKFFPNSKHPLYEISIDEALMIAVYISNRLDEILDRRGLRFLRKFKISTIVGMTEIKENINENEIVKATKKYKILDALKAAKNVINVINPVYYIRKFITNKTINLVCKKLCVVIIGVSGEETYKIYSKSVLNKDIDIDTGVSSIVNEMEEDIEQDLEAKELRDKYDSNEEILKDATNPEILIFDSNDKKKKNKKDKNKVNSEGLEYESSEELLLDKPKEEKKKRGFLFFKKKDKKENEDLVSNELDNTNLEETNIKKKKK